MEGILKLAVVLTAYDKMSETVSKATEEAQRKLMGVGGKKMLEGYGLMEAGKRLAGTLQPAIEAFGDAQEAGNELKASLMGPDGTFNQDTFNKIYSLSNTLSDKFKGSTASYLEMSKVLKNNRINEDDIVGGIGEATAKLSDYFKMAPAEIAEFAAHMKNDMGVQVGQMGQMMDTIARIHNAGVGKTGAEAVNEMNEFFSKASLGAAALGVQGVDATKKLGALGALFVSRGLSGATVGTNFRRILDGLRDPDKLAKVNEVARKYGDRFQLEMFDDKGKFLGMDNFVHQIGKLKELAPQGISDILKSFGGKQGLSTDFLEYLGKNGLQGYDDFNSKIANQAELSDKLGVIMGGLNYQQGVMESSWTNLKSSFGSSLEPALSLFYTVLNKVIVSVREFLDENPKVAKFASAFIALVSAGLMIAGIIRVIQGVRIAMAALNLTMSLGPIGWIVAIAAAVALIYTYWDEISDFFAGLWDSIKEIFTSVGEFLWKFFEYTSPIGWIILFWKPLSKFFSALWGLIKAAFKLGVTIIATILYYFTPAWLIVKLWKVVAPFFKKMWGHVKEGFKEGYHYVANIFNKVVDFIFGLGKSFFQAGANIITMIIKGITSGITSLTNKIKWLTQKIRNFLPFSPAKEGPLRDIHRIRLVETIAEAIKPTSLLNAMKRITGGIFNFFNKPAVSAPIGQTTGRGGMITANFNIYLNGSGTKADGNLASTEIKKQFQELMKQYGNQQSRISFT